MSVPTGWKLVPIVASDSMLGALHDEGLGAAHYTRGPQQNEMLSKCWKALLDAAPTPHDIARQLEGAQREVDFGRRVELPHTHQLKSWPRNFTQVVSCQKKHEVRVFDRPYREGDRIVLQEWDPETEAYTGRTWSGFIGEITWPGLFGLPPNVGVFSLLNDYRP